MIPYKFDYAIERFFGSGPSPDKTLLEIYTGNRISETEAKTLLRRISDHKWYVSERLDRDVGFHVAAIDYVENFYQPQAARFAGARIASISSKAVKAAGGFLKSYLTAKGNTIPI
ncbi:MAG: DUF4032 domain-containing protein [Acidobacteriota bacterium]